MSVLNRVPVREQDPKVRATNFDEVCLGYNMEEAMEEASRCINCKNAKCIQGCPVSINIPAFVKAVKEGKITEAADIIAESSALPAICGRVCPQETQCEGKCIRGIKGDPISIGKLERFVADYALENDIKPEGAETMNGHKVAVIGSGPSGLRSVHIYSPRLYFLFRCIALLELVRPFEPWMPVPVTARCTFLRHQLRQLPSNQADRSMPYL